MAYEIIVRNQTEGDKSGVPVSGAPMAESITPKASPTDTGGGSQAAKSILDGMNKLKTASAVGGLISLKTIAPYVSQAINFGIQNAQLRTGSTEYQQRLQFAKQGLGSAANLGMAALSGATVAGPVGAAVSVGLTALSMLANIGMAQAQIDLNRKVEAEEMTLIQRRAGPAVNRSR